MACLGGLMVSKVSIFCNVCGKAIHAGSVDPDSAKPGICKFRVAIWI
jgi:hypothetical protein